MSTICGLMYYLSVNIPVQMHRNRDKKEQREPRPKDRHVGVTPEKQRSESGQHKKADQKGDDSKCLEHIPVATPENDRKPDKKQCHIQKRLRDSAVNRRVNIFAQVKRLIANRHNVFPGRSVSPPAFIGRQIPERNTTDDKTFVLRQPGSVFGGVNHRLTVLQRQRRRGQQFLRFIHFLQ